MSSPFEEGSEALSRSSSPTESARLDGGYFNQFPYYFQILLLFNFDVIRSSESPRSIMPRRRWRPFFQSLFLKGLSSILLFSISKFLSLFFLNFFSSRKKITSPEVDLKSTNATPKVETDRSLLPSPFRDDPDPEGELRKAVDEGTTVGVQKRTRSTSRQNALISPPFYAGKQNKIIL
jgi:hypothetical protein